MSTPVAATVTASPAAAAANANPTQDFQSALASVLQTPVALSGTTVPGDATLAAAGRVGIAAPSTTAKPSGAKLPHMPAATEAGAEAPSPTATAMPLPDALPSPLVPSLPSSNLPVNLVLRDAEADGAESTPAAPGKAATQAAPQAAATEAPPEPAAPTHGLGSNTADPMIASLPQAGIETFSHHLAAPVGASPSVGADPAPAASPAAPTSHASAPAVPMQLANANATPTATTQVGAAFVVVTRQGEAAPSLTLHLQPPDLGRVAINIEQPKESGAKISLTVEQPETLLMLMRDQPALHKALDSAGIAAEGRTLSFHMASAEGIAPAAASSEVAAAQVQSKPQSRAPDTAGVTEAFAAANELRPLPDTKPLFQAMFTDRARNAVTAKVSSLWAPAKADNNSEAKAQPATQGHDLFTDSPTDIRKMFRGSV